MTGGLESVSLPDAALRYAELGYRVFPCAAGGKTPRTEHGFRDATTDAAQVERWWADCPSANIGLATAGLLALDVDTIDGLSNPWLADHPEQQLDLARAPMQVTPRGGVQYLFRQPEGRSWRCTAGRLAPGVDTRADGGYIVVPPSVRPDGAYRWQETMALDLAPDALPEPPAWLTDLLDQLATTTPTLAQGAADGNRVPAGQRNSTLASLAGTMRRAGMGEAEILAAIRETNRSRCVPPLSETEVRRIAASIARYAPDEVAVAVAENHWAQMTDSPEEPHEGPADPGPFPERLLIVPGFIHEVCQFSLATSFKAQPTLALGAAIALLGTLTGRKVADAYNTRTNVYCLGVCPSGGGKDRARQVNKEVLFHAGLDRLAGPEGVASHAGLIAAVEKQPAVLFQLDEIGRILRTLGEPQRAPHLYHIATVLMKLFTSSASVYIGDAYADTKRNKTINQPHACLYGTTVPRSLYEGLTTESMTDGFLSRMLVFESSDPDPESRDPLVADIPKAILDVARFWGDFRPAGNLSDENPRPLVVPCTDQAKAVFVDLERRARAERQPACETIATLWTRTTEKARKLALIYACSADHQRPAIGEAAARWAADLSEYLTRKMIFAASQWVSETPFEAKRKRVLRELRQAEGGRLTRTQLCRRTKHLQGKERDEIVASLLETGEVRLEKEETGGAPKVTYVAT